MAEKTSEAKGKGKKERCTHLNAGFQRILRRGGKNTQKKCTKKIFTTQIIVMV